MLRGLKLKVKFLMWTPDVIIAMVIIASCLALRFCGINSEVWALLLMATGWVFGGTWQTRKLIKEGKINDGK